MATRTAEAKHEADRMPSEDEAATAEAEADKLRDSGEEGAVAEHYREMTRRGVDQEGEGRIA